MLRLTARLSRDARIAIAGRLGLDEAPATMSLWCDIADDLALVLLAGGDGEAEGAHLADIAEALRRRYIGRLVGSQVTIERRGAAVRVVWLLGPQRLGAWAEEMKARLEGTR